MDLKDFYSMYISNFITDGDIINQNSLGSSVLKTGYNKIYTKKGIKRVYCIRNIQANYKGSLFYDLMEYKSKNMYGCKIICNTYTKPYYVDLEKKQYIHKMINTEDKSNLYESILSKAGINKRRIGVTEWINGERVEVNESMLSQTKDEISSYEYINKCDEEGIPLTITYMFIEVVSKNLISSNRNFKELRKFLNKNKLKFVELKNNLTSYMKHFSPVGSYKDNETKVGMSAMLLSLDNIMQVIPYEFNGISDSVGVYEGINIRRKVPLFLNYREAPVGQNIGVFMKTGHGKTFYCLNKVNGHRLLTHDICIMDYKGGEYSGLNKFGNCIEIALGGSNAVYVNTVEIPYIDYMNSSSKVELYNLCVEATVEQFLEISNVNEEDYSDLSAILSDAMNMMYKKRGIEKELTYTYSKSKGLTPFSLMPILQTLKDSKSFNQGEIELIHKCYSRAKVYFTETGSKSDNYKNPVDIKSCLEAKIIIYNFFKNKTAESKFDTDDTLRIRQMIFLNTIKVNRNKNNKESTVMFFEELQRAIGSRNVLRYINHIATGGRSSYIIGYYIFNSANLFTLDNSDAVGIRSNISTWIVGYIEEIDQHIIQQFGNIKEINNDITLIRERQDLYHNCFAIKYDTGKTRGHALCKVEIPQFIADQEPFQTVKTQEYS